VFGAWIVNTFGNPVPDIIGTVLFWFFSISALVFGTVLVVQKNPGRGAIAFAFVILSTCGLFLLLAAPFLMAATIIIYAGAIIVTFLFVLMLSHADGPSDENNRSREPLYGAFAGFSFVGLVLFTLFITSTKAKDSHLLAPVITPQEQKTLTEVIAKLDEAEKALAGDLSTATARDKQLESLELIRGELAKVVGVSSKDPIALIREGDDSLRARLEKTPGKPGAGAELYREDEQARAVLTRAATVRDTSYTSFKVIERELEKAPKDISVAKSEIRKLRDEVVLLRGASELPASNVRNLGFVLYSEHLLAIELAGTLLLVAVIGAIAVAHRKGVAK
jgi:NADH:ubiquinone oxidoreductase subunit 6 (subunit J)